MRIAHLSGSQLPSRDANSVNSTRMCQAFAAAGHEVALLGRRAPVEVGAAEVADEALFENYGVEPCFEIVRLPVPRGGRGAQLHYGIACRRWLRGQAPFDVLYARHPLALLLAPRGAGWRVFEAHTAPTGRNLWLMRLAFRLGRLQRIVAISEALRRELLRLLPELPSDLILVAHDGADAPALDLVGEEAVSVAGTRPRLRVGYIGHLYPGKGMEMVADLARALPEMDFHVVGGADADLARWRPQVKALSNLVLHGFVAPASTDAHRLAMDVLLAPYQEKVSLRGGVGDIARWMSPLKVFEALAAAKPLLASDLPVLREVLEDEREALLVPPADVAAWAKALERLRDPGLRQRLGTEGRRRFEANYTWAARARRVLDGLS